MATPTQLTQIAFAGGIDESQRPEVLDPSTSFTNVENCRQDARGGLTKRLGHITLATSRFDATSRDTGLTIFDHKGIPCVIDQRGTVDALTEGIANSFYWVSQGRLSEVKHKLLDTQALSAGANTTTGGVIQAVAIDVARAGKFIATLHAANPGTGGTAIYVSVQDNAGNVVRRMELLAQGTVVETVGAIASYGDQYFIAFVCDSNSANIAAWYLNCGSASSITTGWVAMGNIATDHATSGAGALAISTESMTTRVAVAYVNNIGGVDRVSLKTLTAGGVVQSVTHNTNSTSPTALCVEGSVEDTLWLAWNETTTVRVVGFNGSNLSSVLASVANVITLNSGTLDALGIVSHASTAGAGFVICNDGNVDRMHYRGFTTSGGAVATSGSQQTIYNLNIVSRPMKFSTRYYVLVSPDNTVTANAQKTLMLADFTDATTWLRLVALESPGLAVSAKTSGTLPHWVTDGSNTSSRLSPISLTRSGVANAPRLLYYDFTTTTGSRPVAHAGATYIEGGITQVFDGERVGESGYAHAPPAPTTSLGGTGLTGTFRYVLVYETLDSSGNWVQSAVSEPCAAVTPANQTVTVTARTLTCTARLRNATNDVRERIAVYRTATGGEEPYYRLASVYTSPANATVTFADSTADATLTGNALLYGTGSLPSTDGAGLDRMAPPGLRYLTSYNGMLVGAYGSTLWYSSQYVEGEAPWFNPVFTVTLPEEIVALESQDGTLYAFTSVGIWAVSGDPPSDNGSSGGLGVPRRLAVDIGASSWHTCACNIGIFFVSTRGIELLTRGGQSVEYIGEAVQSTFATWSTVTAIVLDHRAALVRVFLVNSAVTSGVSVVFDLTLKVWVSRDFLGSADRIDAKHAAMVRFRGVYRMAQIFRNGTVYVEMLSTETDNIGPYGDHDAPIVSKVETAWFKPSGIQGRMHVNRVLLLAKRHSPHDLKMALAYDYNTSYQTARTWTATETTALAAALPNLQVYHQSHDESPVQAVRVKIEDVPTATTYQGSTWIGLTIDATPQQGAYELPDTAA